MSTILRGAPVRPAAVAGAFYPSGPDRLRSLVRAQLAEAERRSTVAGTLAPLGVLVPHAGLEYSGVVAAAAWRLLGHPAAEERPRPALGDRPTIVFLGTNHRAAWLDGIAAWDSGAWITPLGPVAVDSDLAAAIIGLGPPFLADREAHLDEHSIEVQLPFLREVAPEARIVPLAVSFGIGPEAIDAGRRLGELLLGWRAPDARVGPLVLAVSSDMAHYPSAADAEAVTGIMRPAILGLDPAGVAAREMSVRERAAMGRGTPGLACAMCGVEPAVVGLAALRTLGAVGGTELAASTSADVGGPRERTVGYLAARFD